ncbi:AsmA-like C-terminal region-containing protein [Salmonirosea aquatica]|uniref:AsmA-like C-terminal region-containing protein n=1 Tax=Salmonirosea aquatica TaxID=2654236 RepID=UPI00357146D2
MFKRIIITGLILLVLGLVGGTILWTRTYKSKLLAYVQALTAENLDGRLEVGDVGFTPFGHGLGLTFSFENVSMTDRRFSEHHTPLLRADRVTATLDFDQLFHGSIRIRKVGVEEGSITVFVRRDGYSNASMFEKARTSEVPDTLKKKNGDFLQTLETLSFSNCPIQYTDSLRGKSYGAELRRVTSDVHLTDTLRHFDVDGETYFNGLVFNAAKGSFLRNQLAQVHLSLDFFPTRKLWRVNPSFIRVANPNVDKITIVGYIKGGPKPGFVGLNFGVEKTSLAATLHLLPEKLERAIVRRKILPTVRATVHLRGTLTDPNPRINVRFQTDTFSYPLPYGHLRGMKAEGTFTNRYDTKKPAGDENSRIDVSQAAGFFETIPLQGHLSITNLKVASSVMDFSLRATPATLNALLDSSRYAVGKGTAALTFHYEGSPVTFYDARADRMTGKLRGSLQLSNLSLRNKPGKIDLSQLTGKATFDENTVWIPRLSLYDGRNDLLISGKVMHLPAALFGSINPAQAFVHARIPNWVVTFPDRLAGRRARRTSGKTKFKITKLLDETIDKLQVTASLEVDHMRYHRLRADQVRGQVLVKNQLIELKNLSMNTCGGKVRLSGGIKTFDGQGLPLFYAEGNVDKATVDSVFYSLANFGQKTITDQNLHGILTADFQFESRISNDTTFVKPSMKGFVNLNLDKVRIIDFKPLMDIRKLIFKNRDLDNIKFAPFRTKFILKGEEVEVNRMKVESNVFYFFLDGVYSFGNKTNLSIQIPMNNLRRKAPANHLEIREVEDVKGDVIFLRAIHEGDDVRIRYDKVKRFR